MKKFKNVKFKTDIKGKLLSGAVFIALIAVFIIGTNYIGNMGNEQGLQLTKEAAMRTAVQCYAIEGIYPPNVEYMEKNYNLSYDTSKYFIFYDIFASNIGPTIEVYERR